MRKFLEELKRRNVTRVAVVYLIAGWLTMQVVDVMFPALNLPDWLMSAVAALLLIGFPFALIFAWAFEMTPEGIKREKDVDRSQSITPQTGNQLNRAALIILAVAVGFLLVDKFFLQPDGTESLPAASPTETRPSIAVLPFVNMSGDAENEYFSDGLSEELLNLLAKIRQLHVAGRTSSFKFKGQREDLRVIGEQLNVAHVLEGSVRKSGTRLRITAQLIDTENGYHLWSETYDRELTDIFAVQDEIAAAVVDALRVTLLGGETVAGERATANLEAYELFLQGRYLMENLTAENLRKANQYFARAVELDPDYADAWALRAEAYRQLISGMTGESSDFIEGHLKVREYADRAIRANDKSALAHIAQSIAAIAADWDVQAADLHLARAIELEPNNAVVLTIMANNLLFQSEFDEAISLLEKAAALDPLSLGILRDLGDAYSVAGDVERGQATYRKALELAPSMSRIHGRMARNELVRGNIDEAAKLYAQEDIAWVREMGEILVLGARGQRDEWRQAVDAYSDRHGSNNAYQMVEILGHAGEIDEAFEWAEIGIEVRDPGMPWFGVSRLTESLRKDPRAQQVLESLGLSPSS